MKKSLFLMFAFSLFSTIHPAAQKVAFNGGALRGEITVPAEGDLALATLAASNITNGKIGIDALAHKPGVLESCCASVGFLGDTVLRKTGAVVTSPFYALSWGLRKTATTLKYVTSLDFARTSLGFAKRLATNKKVLYLAAALVLCYFLNKLPMYYTHYTWDGKGSAPEWDKLQFITSDQIFNWLSTNGIPTTIDELLNLIHSCGNFIGLNEANYAHAKAWIAHMWDIILGTTKTATTFEKLAQAPYRLLQTLVNWNKVSELQQAICRTEHAKLTHFIQNKDVVEMCKTLGFGPAK